MEYLLKSSAVVILFYFCFYGFLRKETFFQKNRWYFVIGLCLATLFPLVVIPIEISIPTIDVQSTFHVLNENSQTQIASSIEEEAAFNWYSLLPVFYFLGLALCLIQFLLQFGSLLYILVKHPKNHDGIYTYVVVNNKISPFSFFKWIVYNPNNYNDAELNLILTHEKIHARQWHTIDLLLTQLACVVFWFNPFIWLYRKAVQQNLEYIADYETQTNLRDTKYYKHLLLKTSVVNTNFSLSNNFYNSLIKERIVMLQKSRSHKRNRWKYLLILPLLTGLLLSMNTKKVYVEDININAEESNFTAFVVRKNTTNLELDEMSKTIKEKGGLLEFNQIKRNTNNEITNIFVKLNNHSYGGGNSKAAINNFIIYKEFYGKQGGYVGRPYNGTIHFDNLENPTSKEIKRLQNRVNSKMKELRFSFSKKNDGKLKHQAGNNKEVKLKSTFNQDLLVSKINKNTTDNELEAIKNDLKEKGLTVKFKKIKRNNKSEIRAIKIEAKSKNSSTSYSVSASDEPIKPISISFDSKNKTISISSEDKKPKKQAFILNKASKNQNSHIVNRSKDKVVIVNEQQSKTSNLDTVWVFRDTSNTKKIIATKAPHVIDSNADEEQLKIIFRQKDKNGKTKTIFSSDEEIIASPDGEKIEVIYNNNGNQVDKVIVTKKKQIIFENGTGKNFSVTELIDDNTNKEAEIIFLDDSSSNIKFFNPDGKDPLYIINGKEATKEEFKKILPNSIKSITVLKDKSAKKKYGKKAENGVLEIITNNQ